MGYSSIQAHLRDIDNNDFRISIKLTKIKKKGRLISLSSLVNFIFFIMKIIKKGQTNPVYSAPQTESLNYSITGSKLGNEVS